MVRIACLVVIALLLFVEPAGGDALVVTQAMKAPTIAQIFVTRGGMRVELEISGQDLRRIMVEDAAAPAEAIASPWLVRADGKSLSGVLKTLEKRRRVRRDEITGEPLSAGADAGEPVLFMVVEFAFESAPATLSIRPPGAGTKDAFSIGFVAYHLGVPVADFRYLGSEVTLDLDWEDPWYSKFRHRNLRRHYAAPISAFLYIEPFEVRHEIVLRPKDLQHMVDLGLDGKEVIAAGEQAVLKERIVAFLSQKTAVEVDGEPVTLSLDRAHFIRRTLRTTSVIDPPEDLPILTAMLGVIFYAPTEVLPQEVSMRWGLWSPRIQEIPASATDEAGPFPSVLTPRDPVLVWRNVLQNPRSFVLTDVERPLEGGSIPLAGLLAACLATALAIRALRIRRWGIGGAAVGAAILSLFIWPHVRVSLPGGALAAPADERAVVDGLLKNTYRSFDGREESVIYDRLARSIAGPLLEDVFLQIRKRTELASQGGARIKVSQVDLVAYTSQPRGGGAGFHGECTWDVSGSVGHWGHVHQRTNRYRATLRVEPLDGAWRIAALELLDETRLLEGQGR